MDNKNIINDDEEEKDLATKETSVVQSGTKGTVIDRLVDIVEIYNV